MTTDDARRIKVRRWRQARAELLRRDPTAAPHGHESTYKNWVCRCTHCRTAHAEHRAAERAARNHT